MRFASLFTVAAAGALLAASLLAFHEPAAAQQQEQVRFSRGANSAVINGVVRGRNYVDYLIGARAGQRLTVSMTSRNRSAYFNLIAPGQTGIAYYVGSNSYPVNRFDGLVPADGVGRIRVYLFRAAARRGEVAAFQLRVSISGRPNRPGWGGGADAIVPGTPYHATGPLRCVVPGVNRGCQFGVIRLGPGAADVTVMIPNGISRRISFRNGQAVGADSGPAGGAFGARRNGDETIVQMGGETYVIPDAVVFGG